jgi:hypothetical protein
VTPLGAHRPDLVPYFAWLQAAVGAEWLAYTGWPIEPAPCSDNPPMTLETT